MIKTFDDIKYKMRWQFPKSKIIYLYGEFVKKYNSKLTIHQWMIGYGVVHSSINEKRRINMTIKIRATLRGFTLGEFIDANGQECSIQNSSAMDRHGLLWFGIDDVNPQIMKDGKLESVPIPNCVIDKHNVNFNDRMHINKRQAATFVRNFEKFIETGKVKTRKFIERNRIECSIRKTNNMIELGCDDANPQYCQQGWRPIQFPEGTIFHTHMFLAKEQINELLPLLKEFVENGFIALAS